MLPSSEQKTTSLQKVFISKKLFRDDVYKREDSIKEDIKISPQAKKTNFFQNMNLSYLNEKNQGNAEEKPLNFPRFIVTGNKGFKKSRSLTPPTKPQYKASKLDFSKFKDIKTRAQESEIKLQHLHGLLKREMNVEEITSRKVRINICLQMINAAYILNDEMTTQFKDIVPVLEEFIFCSEEISRKINTLFKEKISLKSEICGSVISKMIEKINEMKENHIKATTGSENEIQELNIKLEHKNKDNLSLKNTLRDLEERIKMKFQSEILQQQEKKMMLESEIRLIQNENSTLRNDFEKQSHDFFHLEKKMKNEISNEMKRLSDEKDEAIQIMSTQGKEHEALKLIYGKLALNHKALCSSMKILKEKLENQQRKNSDLMNENQNLKIKAGVAWGDLTPRPSFEKFGDLIKLESNCFQNKSSKTILDDIIDMIKKKFMIKKNDKKFEKIKSFRSFKNIDEQNTSSCLKNKILKKKTMFANNRQFLNPNVDSEQIVSKSSLSNLDVEINQIEGSKKLERKENRAWTTQPRKSLLEIGIIKSDVE